MKSPKNYRNQLLYGQGKQELQPMSLAMGDTMDRYYDDYQSAHRGRERVAWILDLLHRQKWLIYLCLLVAICASTAVLLSRDTFYDASNFIMLDLNTEPGEPRSQGVGSEALSGDNGNLFGRNDRSFIDELFVLRNSNDLALRVAKRLKAAQSDTGLALPILNLDEGEPLSLELVAQRLQQKVHFEPVPESYSIIRINAISEVPEEAILIANSYAEEYAGLTQEAKGARLQALQGFLEAQLEGRSEDLQEKEEALEAYIARYTTSVGVNGLDQGSQLLMSRIASLEARRDEVRLQIQLEESALQVIEQDQAELAPQMAEYIATGLERQIQSAQEKIEQLQDEREQIVKRNPDPDRRSDVVEAELEELDARVQDLQAGVSRLASQLVNEGLALGGTSLQDAVTLRQQVAQKRAAIEGLREQVTLIERQLQEQEAELHRIPSHALALAQLERARMYAEQMHQHIVQRLLDTRLAVELEQGSGYVRIIRKATFGVPVNQDAWWILSVGMLAGLFLGLALAILRETLDNRIYRPEQVRKQGYVDLGVVPDMRPLIQDTHRGQPFVEVGGKQYATSLVALLNPSSQVAEAYRRLRANVLHMVQQHTLQTLLVTSPSMGEGKSVTATNLALFVAQAGYRTLLIDADLRRPQLHRLLGLKTTVGLWQVLAGEVSVAEAATPVIENLSVITAGSTRNHAAPNESDFERDHIELDKRLSSARARQMFEELQGGFDLVIVDTPPLHAATDAVTLSTHCDAALVVARAGETKEGDLDYALEALADVETEVIGVVINGFRPPISQGYKYRYHNYAYSRLGQS